MMVHIYCPRQDSYTGLCSQWLLVGLYLEGCGARVNALAARAALEMIWRSGQCVRASGGRHALTIAHMHAQQHVQGRTSCVAHGHTPYMSCNMHMCHTLHVCCCACTMGRASGTWAVGRRSGIGIAVMVDGIHSPMYLRTATTHFRASACARARQERRGGRGGEGMHMPHATCHMPHATCHMPHATCITWL